MLFSSTTFIFIFLPAVLVVYYALKSHRKAQNVILCLFSLFFYAWGEPWFVFIMMASIVVNWFAGKLISERAKTMKNCRIILIADIVFNLGILYVFKYLVFTLKSINWLLLSNFSVPKIALPIGISFFTFQAISYVVDVYRNKAAAQNNIMNVALYISFFPQLIAGPIVRYETIADQIINRQESWEDFSEGVTRFIVGLGKKVIIANNLALVADAAFDFSSGATTTWFGVETTMGAGLAWLGALAYTFQIFFDFSGYSDMAIGLGKMFGFHFLENFNYPYISVSVTDFWRRWHISLGTWFRDYIYIPLGGSRCSSWRNLLNLFIVWLCTGIWHGANTTFIVWGLMYCVLLIVERSTGLNKLVSNSVLANAFRRLYTLFFVVMGWVIFRADSLHQAIVYFGNMFSFQSNSDLSAFFIREYGVFFVIAIIASIPVVPYLKKKVNAKLWSVISLLFIAVVGIVSISYIVKGSYNPFIYFNF